MLLPVASGALPIAGIACVALFHLRHFGLFALVLLAPVPGLAAVAFVMPLWTNATVISAGLAYLVGLSGGLVLAGDLAILVCDGADAESATHAALRGRGIVLSVFILALAAAVLSLATIGDADMAAFTGAALVAAGGFAAIAGFYLARFLPYGENFVTYRNRMQERWNRVIERSIAVARPRWGFSVAGIALVFAVLGFFGAQTLKVPAEMAARAMAVFPGAGVAIFAAIAVATRDWRIMLAAVLAQCPPLLIGLWGLALMALPLDAKNLLFLILALGAGAVPLVVAGAEAGRTGDDAAIAAARTLLRSGLGFFFASAIPALAVLFAIPLLGGIGIALAAAFVFAAAEPLLFLPAFAIVIETWCPRPSAATSRYRLS